jgi:hypothetical protein
MVDPDRARVAGMPPDQVADVLLPEPAAPGALPSKLGHNDPCACGSGRKSKRCCGRESPRAAWSNEAMTPLLALVVLVLVMVGAVSYYRHEHEQERHRARELWGDGGDAASSASLPGVSSSLGWVTPWVDRGVRSGSQPSETAPR